MSIINSCDLESKPLVGIEDFIEKGDLGVECCIVAFSHHVLELVLNTYKCENVGHSGTANGHIEIYKFNDNGKDFLFYMSPIGSCVSTMTMHEVAYLTGAKKFIVYGSCGILNKELCEHKLIVPTSAYRDEGTSYHYLKESDFIDIKNYKIIADIFSELNYPYILGKTWTTDAIYMETKNKVLEKRKLGCVSVEMEASGLQSICDYYGYELYTFYFGGDVFDDSSWDKSNLGGLKERDIQRNVFKIALELARNI